MWKTPFFGKFAVFNLFALAGIGIAVNNGLVSDMFAADHTYITYVIVAFALMGFVRCAYTAFKVARAEHAHSSEGLDHITDDLTYYANTTQILGLVGTVLGFIIAIAQFKSANLSNAQELLPLVGRFLGGMSIALYATVTATIGALWVNTNAKLIRHHVNTLLLRNSDA